MPPKLLMQNLWGLGRTAARRRRAAANVHAPPPVEMGDETENEEVHTEENVGGEFGNSSATNLEDGADEQSLFERMREKIVIICVYKRNPNVNRTFTGFYVGDGLILTSSIVLDLPSDLIKVITLNDNMEEMDEVEGLPEPALKKAYGSLAILQMGSGGNSSVRIGDDTVPVVGRTLYSISHPEWHYFSFMCGKVVSPLKRMRGAEFTNHANVEVIQLHGFSGGNASGDMEFLGAPVFDGNGDVVGMIVSAAGGFEYAVPASALKDCLSRFESGT